ncbi:unnamed protein product, partial [Pylaiella littoralis]
MMVDNTARHSVAALFEVAAHNHLMPPPPCTIRSIVLRCLNLIHPLPPLLFRIVIFIARSVRSLLDIIGTWRSIKSVMTVFRAQVKRHIRAALQQAWSRTSGATPAR